VDFERCFGRPEINGDLASLLEQMPGYQFDLVPLNPSGEEHLMAYNNKSNESMEIGQKQRNVRNINVKEKMSGIGMKHEEKPAEWRKKDVEKIIATVCFCNEFKKIRN
jgi:ABC-type uncharacterized transport system involved in gliding motility auxiliary subunit